MTPTTMAVEAEAILPKQIPQEMFSWLKETKDFITDQAPKVCNEIINSGILTYSIWVAVDALAVLLSVLMLLSMIRTFNEENRRRTSDVENSLVLFFLGVSIVGFVLFVRHLYCLIFIFLCPRSYILEYIKTNLT